jgi:hypothetical protein
MRKYFYPSEEGHKYHVKKLELKTTLKDWDGWMRDFDTESKPTRYNFRGIPKLSIKFLEIHTESFEMFLTKTVRPHHRF